MFAHGDTENTVCITVRSQQPDAMHGFQPVTHVIFDIDGLLLDTEKIYVATNEQLAAKYGKKYTWDVRMKVMGIREQETAKIIVSELDLPLTYEEYLREAIGLQRTLFQQAEFMPGALRLVRHLAEHKIPIALATSSGKQSVESKFAKHKEIFSLFNHAVIGSSDPEISMGKPEPHIFLVCASRFPDKPNPKNCLVFEDAPNGVIAAKRAGMQVVMVPDERVTQQECEPATLVLKTLLEFKPEEFGLPPFTDIIKN